MAELTPLADFPATVCRVKTLVDNGIRVELDLTEEGADMLTELYKIKLEGKSLRVVLYDDDEFRASLIAENKQG